MKEQFYREENGMAVLTLIRQHGIGLCCSVPVEVLPFLDTMLNNAGLPKFKEWFDKDQDFGWLFRQVFSIQVKIALKMQSNNNDVCDYLKPSFVNKIAVERENLQINFEEYLGFIEAMKQSYSSGKYPLISYQELTENYSQVMEKFSLSYSV